MSKPKNFLTRYFKGSVPIVKSEVAQMNQEKKVEDVLTYFIGLFGCV
jgi:hypothetical protein